MTPKSASKKYFDLLTIVQIQEKLDNLGRRLEAAAERLIGKKIALSPSDRPFEVFEAEEGDK